MWKVTGTFQETADKLSQVIQMNPKGSETVVTTDSYCFEKCG